MHRDLLNGRSAQPTSKRIGYNAANNSSDGECAEKKDRQGWFHVSQRMPNQNSEKTCKAKRKYRIEESTM